MRNNESFKLSSVLMFHLHGNHIESSESPDDYWDKKTKFCEIISFDFIRFSFLRIVIKEAKPNESGIQPCFQNSICRSAVLDPWM